MGSVVVFDIISEGYKHNSAIGLNAMGLRPRTEDHFRDSNALHKSILSWTKKNYAWLHSDNPHVAEACLVDGITYDPERLRLVKTYPAGLTREDERVFLEVDPPSPYPRDDPSSNSTDNA